MMLRLYNTLLLVFTPQTYDFYWDFQSGSCYL